MPHTQLLSWQHLWLVLGSFVFLQSRQRFPGCLSSLFLALLDNFPILHLPFFYRCDPIFKRTVLSHRNLGLSLNRFTFHWGRWEQHSFGLAFSLFQLLL